MTFSVSVFADEIFDTALLFKFSLRSSLKSCCLSSVKVAFGPEDIKKVLKLCIVFELLSIR